MSDTIKDQIHQAFGNLPSANKPPYACKADGSPDPEKFPGFVAESFASWQLARATAWVVVALLTR